MEQLSIISFFSFALIAIFWGIKLDAQTTLVVAKDGSGNFTTITEAILASPNNSPKRTYINIKAGIYNENVIINKEKKNLYLLGDGMERTVVSGNRSTNMGFKTYETATVEIEGDGFLAAEITFENTAGPNMSQAVAVTNSGTYTAFYRCRFLGYQDTLYVKEGIQFYRECDVYGTVDFIFGFAKVLFQNCNIYVRRPRLGQSNTITAQGRDESNLNSGIVMQNCTITAAMDLVPNLKVKTYLGRPWRNDSITVIMQSYLDKLIDPKGWLEWEGRTLDSVYYGEYQNRGPGSNIQARVKWARVITTTVEATKFTARNFIYGKKWINSTGFSYYLDLI